MEAPKSKLGIVQLLFYDYTNKFFGGTFISQFDATPFAMAFVVTNFFAASVRLRPGMEQKDLCLSGGSIKTERMHPSYQTILVLVS